MRSILDGSSVLIFVKDLEGRFTFVNRALTERMGLSREELIGHTVEELFPSEAAGKYTESDRVAVIEGSKQFEEVMQTRNGIALYLTTKFPLLNREGKPYAVCGLSTDITERKRAEERLVRLNRELQNGEERFRKIADLVPDMLWSAELNGKKRFVSQRFQRYTGVGGELDFNRAGWQKILHPDDVKDMAQHFAGTPPSHETWEREVRLRRFDGKYRWFMSRTAPVCDDAGEVDYWLGSFNDIDESKRTEQALRQSNEELDQIAYAAAHDLQEPMRNVSISLGMLRNRFERDLGKEETNWIEESTKNARRMQTMVKDLLQFSRVISDGERAELAESASLAVEQAMRNLAEEIHASRAKVEMGDLPAVQMREPHLVMLFQNLISNAIKYRKSGLAPVVRISASRHAEGWLFSVTDNGIGFDPAYAKRIFKVFKRLHNREEYSGNGIGLAVCARIVAHYGGRIWAEAEPGEGATFLFTISELT
jgi:PAS domain S-box-containing protein